MEEDSFPPYLQMFWGVNTSIFGATTIYLMLLRTYWDKNEGAKAPEEKRGVMEFHKRPFQLCLFALVWTTYITYTAVNAYCWGGQPNTYLAWLMDYINTPTTVSSDYISTVIGLAFFVVHLLRRVYETWSVSIYSQRQVCNPLSVLLSYAHYLAVGLSLIAESAPLTQVDACVTTEGFALRHIAALVIYFFGSKVQHETLQQLARLRRNRAGHVVTTDYKMPKGGWFEYCSCPHYFAEIVIYVSVGLALGTSNATWWWLVIFVFISQFYRGYNAHQYYEDKFKDFPKRRNFLIPYVI